jgi:hypothetical protein
MFFIKSKPDYMEATIRLISHNFMGIYVETTMLFMQSNYQIIRETTID